MVLGRLIPYLPLTPPTNTKERETTFQMPGGQPEVRKCPTPGTGNIRKCPGVVRGGGGGMGTAGID